MDAASDVSSLSSILKLIEPSKLIPHEETHEDKVKEIIDSFETTGLWMQPIMVDSGSLVLMDGHHRRQAAIRMKLIVIPCLMLSYDLVSLEFWNNCQACEPETLISNAKSGKLLPPKTTRHIAQITFSMNPVKIASLFDSGSM